MRERGSASARAAAILLLLLAGVSGCSISNPNAGSVSSSPASGAPDRALAPSGPGADFVTVEAAAVDALAHAHVNRSAATRERFLVGTIHRTRGGYAYRVPARASERVLSLGGTDVRFQLRAGDVATYIVHPRSGSIHLDRMNEAFSRSERTLVEERDPGHRPLYLLTPSLVVKVYRDGSGASAIGSLKSESARAGRTGRSRGGEAAEAPVCAEATPLLLEASPPTDAFALPRPAGC